MIRRTAVSQVKLPGQTSVPVYTVSQPQAQPAPVQPQAQPVPIPPAAQPVPAQPAAQIPDPLAELKAKFNRLNSLNNQLGGLKPAYNEQEALLEELLPLFVTVTSTDIIIHREITLGSEKHRIRPTFIDPETGRIRSKVYKATMQMTFTIE